MSKHAVWHLYAVVFPFLVFVITFSLRDHKGPFHNL